MQKQAALPALLGTASIMMHSTSTACIALCACAGGGTCSIGTQGESQCFLRLSTFFWVCR